MKESFWDIMASDDPAVIEQCRQWLDDVQPNARRNLDRRLHGNYDDYRSARMELLLHHLFHERGFGIAWEPALPGTRRVTEFRAKSADTTILVEAKSSGSERAFRDHSDVNEPLAERFEELNLPAVLSFEFADTPPPLHSLGEVWSKAREAVIQAEYERDTGASFHAEVGIQINAATYMFRFSLVAPGKLYDSDARGLVIPSTPVLKIDPGRKLYDDILQKATRYGDLREPFLIVVWGRYAGRESPEIAALYGQARWALTQGTEGPQVSESRHPDGIFTTFTDEGGPRHVQVSAVAFIRSLSTGGTVNDSLVVYHNPFAAYPLDSSILANFRQFISEGNQMMWSPDQPPVE